LLNNQITGTPVPSPKKRLVPVLPVAPLAAERLVPVLLVAPLTAERHVPVLPIAPLAAERHVPVLQVAPLAAERERKGGRHPCAVALGAALPAFVYLFPVHRCRG